jgi:hypothetical protein
LIAEWHQLLGDALLFLLQNPLLLVTTSVSVASDMSRSDSCPAPQHGTTPHISIFYPFESKRKGIQSGERGKGKQKVKNITNRKKK